MTHAKDKRNALVITVDRSAKVSEEKFEEMVGMVDQFIKERLGD